MGVVAENYEYLFQKYNFIWKCDDPVFWDKLIRVQVKNDK